MPTNEDELERQYRRCVISCHDFDQAGEYLDAYLKGGHDELICRALISSAVVSYARPFTRNFDSGLASASNKVPLDLDALLTADQLKLHSLIMDFRNKGVAHSDSEFNPAYRIPRKDSAVESWSVPFNIHHRDIDVPGFQGLVARLPHECLELMHAIDKQLPDTARVDRIALALKSNSVTRISIKLSDMFRGAPVVANDANANLDRPTALPDDPKG